MGEKERKRCLENGDGVGNTVLISAGTFTFRNLISFLKERELMESDEANVQLRRGIMRL